jgi:hypothetical protein
MQCDIPRTDFCMSLQNIRFCKWFKYDYTYDTTYYWYCFCVSVQYTLQCHQEVAYLFLQAACHATFTESSVWRHLSFVP